MEGPRHYRAALRQPPHCVLHHLCAQEPSPQPLCEREVLAQLAHGLTDKEIAQVLRMSRHTAVNHVAAIRRKLGVPTRAAAVAIATRLEVPGYS